MDTDRLDPDLTEALAQPQTSGGVSPASFDDGEQAMTRQLTKPVPPKMEIISDPPLGKLEFAFGVGCTSATYWLIVYALAQALGVF